MEFDRICAMRLIEKSRTHPLSSFFENITIPVLLTCLAMNGSRYEFVESIVRSKRHPSCGSLLESESLSVERGTPKSHYSSCVTLFRFNYLMPSLFPSYHHLVPPETQCPLQQLRLVKLGRTHTHNVKGFMIEARTNGIYVRVSL